MASHLFHDLARRYCVDDIPGASIPHARLQQILVSIDHGKPLTQRAREFLLQQNLVMLHRFATDDLSYEAFQERALAEQALRIQTATVFRLAQEAEAQRQEATNEEKRQASYAKATADRLARENDPLYQSKIRNQKLRASYNITMFVEQPDFNRLMSILKRVDAYRRLNENDVV